MWTSSSGSAVRALRLPDEETNTCRQCVGDITWPAVDVVEQRLTQIYQSPELQIQTSSCFCVQGTSHLDKRMVLKRRLRRTMSIKLYTCIGLLTACILIILHRCRQCNQSEKCVQHVIHSIQNYMYKGRHRFAKFVNSMSAFKSRGSRCMTAGKTLYILLFMTIQIQTRVDVGLPTSIWISTH